MGKKLNKSEIITPETAAEKITVENNASENAPVQASVKNTAQKKTKEKRKHPVLTGLVLVIAAGIIGVIIACVKYFCTSAPERHASATIEFNYDGAAMNKTPSGEKFSISGLSGDEVINAALQSCNLYGKYTAEDIQKCIVVDGSYPDDIVDQIKKYDSLFDFSSSREVSVNEYFPTIFTLTLYDDFDSSISSADLSKLCEAIVTTYKKTFMKEYVNSFDMSDFDELFPLSKYDYSQRVKVLSYRAKMIQKYALALYTEKTDFKFNELSFNDLSSRCLDLMNNSLTKVDALVTMNALSTDSTRLKNQYEYEIKLLQNELANTETCLTDIDSLIAVYQTDDIIYIGSGDAVTKIDSNSTVTYEELMDDRAEITDRLTAIKADIDKYTLYLEDLKGGNTAINEKSLIADVEQKIIDVQTQLDSLEVQFKEMVAAYNDTLVSDDSIIISPTTYTAPKLLSGGFIVQVIKCCGPLCILVLILCFLYGFICEVKKQKMA